MLIATRSLKVRQGDSESDIPVRLFQPEAEEGRGWGCRFEIEWPDRTISMIARGFDSIQALEIALQLIGVQLYTSSYHDAGQLIFEKPGGGYGFPVPRNMRDLLIGDDTKQF
jgi:hypothetical protein